MDMDWYLVIDHAFLLREQLAPVLPALEAAIALRRLCAPKKQWASRQEAETQLHDILVHRKEKDRARLHTYECPHCRQGNGKPWWHVGHSAAAKR